MSPATIILLIQAAGALAVEIAKLLEEIRMQPAPAAAQGTAQPTAAQAAKLINLLTAHHGLSGLALAGCKADW
jgi:hypothetical protein